MRARPPAAPDFPRLVRTLQHHGLRSSAIAKELGVASSTVGRWLSASARPGFTHGAHLVQLLQRQAPSAVPRELAPLLMMLTPTITADLRAANVIVADLRAAALRL